MNCKFSSFFLFLVLVLGQMTFCTAQNNHTDNTDIVRSVVKTPLQTGAQQMTEYLPLLRGKRVAMLVNQTSVVPNAEGQLKSLVDSLIDLDVDVQFLMAPEHGLKGLVSAGDAVGDSHYEKKQSLQVYSLYGKNKKPKREWMDQVDCIVFDIQDVGCRFYTYLSTLYYLLEACKESDTEVIVLDRPNPHDTIDGPVLDLKFQSFVGMVQVPLLHGCTLGELAKMMIGENWILPNDKNVSQPKLTVIPCKGWKHGDSYSLPVSPSPNLRTDHAIRLYPSLCLFEATDISVGRGTDSPFEVLGHPAMKGEYSFTPKNCEAATHPLQENNLCHGMDLRQVKQSKGFSLQWLMECHRQMSSTANPTVWIKQNTFFDRLAGTDQLRLQLGQGLTEEQIRATWQPALNEYRAQREKYVIY